jgi:uncharacterized 2Fe-2S/4Fe-4S cluster protein (DUF4445 family)
VAGEAEVLVPDASLVLSKRMRVTDLRGQRESAVFAGFRQTLQGLGFAGDSGLEWREVRLNPPTLDDPAADRERLRAAYFSVYPPPVCFEMSLEALAKLPSVLRVSGWHVVCAVRVDETSGKHTIADIAPACPAPSPLVGLAVDIGTTTVSALLVDLLTGEPLAAGSAGNAQLRYGADVINRIIQSTRPGGLARLRTAIREESLAPLIDDMCRTAGITPADIKKVAFAGNTTMTHLALGIPAEYVRLEPYVPAFFRAEGLAGPDIAPCLPRSAEVLAAPCIGSYVGGDITAGVFASMLPKQEQFCLFIDLGTNGELVFGGAEFLLACACSAGPAFEGGDISCGMRAADGAIESCRLDADTLELEISVMGEEGTKPAGICGSGLIDLIAELFRCGVINAKGKIIRSGLRIRRDDAGVGSFVAVFAPDTESGADIALTEVDIDNFIRAKGSIFSAVRTLLAVAGCEPGDLAAVYVAGGIGSGIGIANAISIGMLPNLPEERFHYLGNTSLLGAYAMLTSRAACAEVEAVGAGMTYIELSAHPGYMDEFVAACFLPHTDATLFGPERGVR